MYSYSSYFSLKLNSANLMNLLSKLISNIESGVNIGTIKKDEVSKIYTISFHRNLGDVPLLQEVNGYLNATISKVSQSSELGLSSFILVDEKPTGLFNAYTDTAATIKAVVDNSFGIRCPNSIQVNNSKESFQTFVYETCTWGDDMVSEVAFCGKCANRNTASLFTNLNVSLSYQFVSHFICC